LTPIKTGGLDLQCSAPFLSFSFFIFFGAFTLALFFCCFFCFVFVVVLLYISKSVSTFISVQQHSLCSSVSCLSVF
jgi:hypothetical protein